MAANDTGLRLRQLEGWRIDAARELRDLERQLRFLRRELRACVEQVEGMTREDAIALGVKTELDRRGTAQFSLWQKVAGFAIAGSAVASVVIQAVHF